MSLAALTLGIDEAGRGPAIGPLVMAAVAVNTKTAAALTKAGLADSKSYGAGPAAHGTRSALANVIRQRAQWFTVEVIDVNVIDQRVFRGELNALERETAAMMISKAPACRRIFADGARMFEPMRMQFPHMICKDGAESLHAAVAAASVLAKCARDAIMAEIAAKYATDFGIIRGGGYVNDGTRDFLRAFAKRHADVPAELRMSWPHPYLEDLLDVESIRAARLKAAGIETSSTSLKKRGRMKTQESQLMLKL
jgi:ribonuclease HII